MKRISILVALAFYVSILGPWPLPQPAQAAAPVIKDLIVKNSPYADVRAYGNPLVWLAWAVDNTTNVTTELNAAFAVPGIFVQLPRGTFKVTSNLTEPVCSGIIGTGENQSIISAAAGVTKVLSLGSECTVLRDFQVTGNATNNAVGIFFGDAESGAYSVRNVRVKNFTGTNAVGVRWGNALKSHVDRLTGEGNYLDLLVQGVSAGYPTSTIFTNSNFNTATGTNGIKLVSGEGIHFLNCVTESNAQEGVKMLPASAGILRNIVFDHHWFEANYGTDTAKYQFVAGDGTALGGAVINPILRDCFFSTTGSTAKPIRMNGSAVSRFIIDNPVIISIVDNSISVENDASGEVRWHNTLGVFSTSLSDANNRVSSTGFDNWRAWTPTVVANGAGISGAATITTAQYKRTGKTVHVILYISGTLAGAGTTYFTVTVPTNLTTKNDTYAGGNVQDGATYAPASMASVTDGKIYFGKADNSAWGSGATFIVRGSLTYELP